MTKKVVLRLEQLNFVPRNSFGTEIGKSPCYQYVNVVPHFVPVVPDFVLFRESL